MNPGHKMSRFVTSGMDKLIDQILLEYTTSYGCGCVVTVNPKSTWSADHKRVGSSMMMAVKLSKVLKKYIPTSQGKEENVINEWILANGIKESQIKREVALCSPKYPFISCRIDALMFIDNRVVGVEFKGVLNNDDFNVESGFFANKSVMLQIITYSIVFGIDVYLVWGFKRKNDILIKTKLFTRKNISLKMVRSFNLAVKKKIAISFSKNIFVWKVIERMKSPKNKYISFFSKNEIVELKKNHLALIQKKKINRNKKKKKIGFINN